MPNAVPMPSANHTIPKSQRFVPPFHNGDRMDQKTFHALYETTPDGFKAELIGGIVYMSSPASRFHAAPHQRLASWLGNYHDATDGTEALIEISSVLSDESEPQPDLALIIAPEAGGARFDDRGYLLDPPHFVIEVAYSSAAIDLHAKKRDYDVNGVREYVVVVVPTKTVHWFVRGKAGFEERKPDAAGVLKSKVFPGLWLLPDAVFDRRATRLLATLRLGLASPEHAKFAAKLQAKLAKKAK